MRRSFPVVSSSSLDVYSRVHSSSSIESTTRPVAILSLAIYRNFYMSFVVPPLYTIASLILIISQGLNKGQIDGMSGQYEEDRVIGFRNHKLIDSALFNVYREI